MTATVTIVDYGVGNLLSVRRALEYCGARVALTELPKMVMKAERLVLPGVGAFGDCVAELKARGLDDGVRSFVDTGRPLLGICVGMQMLLDESEEFGRHDGLGLISGKVAAIPRTTVQGKLHKIPHIGWSALEMPENAENGLWKGTLLDDVAPAASAYFVHSFTAAPDNPAHRLADCHYNGRLISAAVRKNNITGTQFHPEKSGPVGLAIVSRFLSV